MVILLETMETKTGHNGLVTGSAVALKACLATTGCCRSNSWGEGGRTSIYSAGNFLIA